MEETTEQVKNKLPEDVNKIPNPTGKGGFADNPQNRNNGGRPKNDVSIVYWIKEYLKQKEVGHDKERAQELAEKIVHLAYKDGNVILIKELLERIEGKTPVRIEGNLVDGLMAVAEKFDAILNNTEDDKDTTTREDNTTNTETN